MKTKYRIVERIKTTYVGSPFFKYQPVRRCILQQRFLWIWWDTGVESNDRAKVQSYIDSENEIQETNPS